jgi:hypothetical protein
MVFAGSAPSPAPPAGPEPHVHPGGLAVKEMRVGAENASSWLHLPDCRWST